MGRYRSRFTGRVRSTFWVDGRGKRHRRWLFEDLETHKRHKRSSHAAIVELKGRLEAEYRGKQRLLSGEEAESWNEFSLACEEHGFTVREGARRFRLVLAERDPYYKQAISVADLVSKFIAARRAEGVSGVHLADLSSRLSRFVRDGVELTGPDIDRWLGGLECSLRTRANYRGALENLCNWAEGRKLIARVDFREVAAPKIRRRDPAIWTPDEMRRLLEAATPSLVPVLVLGGFAGLRTSEIFKLDWSGLDFAAGEITVPSDTKTGRRLVPMMGNLRAWLEPLKGVGPVMGIAMNGVTKAYRRAAARAGLRWRANALRHSFVSYAVAVTSDLPRVSLWCGHSVGMLEKHYRKLATAGQGKGWFAIEPRPAQLNLFRLTA